MKENQEEQFKRYVWDQAQETSGVPDKVRQAWNGKVHYDDYENSLSPTSWTISISSDHCSPSYYVENNYYKNNKK